MTEDEEPIWQNRVLARTLKRAEEAARARTTGPTTRIVKAALELAAETASMSFTVQELVDRAGVALQTFYRHFGSKDALMLAVIEESVRSQRARMAERAAEASDPLDRLRIIIMTVFRTANTAVEGSLDSTILKEARRLRDDYPDELATLIAPYLRLIQEAIVDADAASLINSEDPELDAQLINELVSATFMQATTGSRGPNSFDTETYIWLFCLRALGAESHILAGAAQNKVS